MQARHLPWLLLALIVGVPLLAVGPAGSAPAPPPRVAVESVGIATHTGCAVVHIGVTEPLAVRLDRPADGRLVAEFAGAVLAPAATSALDRAPGLRDAISLVQTDGHPPGVRLEAASPRGEPPAVERFADGRGLVVRLLLEPERAPAAVSGKPPANGPITPAGGGGPAARVVKVFQALTGLALPPMVGSPDARTPEAPLLLTNALTELPTGALAARPQPRDARPVVRRLRLVELRPLIVALDCSQPMQYELAKAEAGGYVLRLPGAGLDASCERSIALRPTLEGYVTIEESADGVAVSIPTGEGETCVVRAGASPSTIVCEVVPEASAPQTPPTPPQPTGETLVNLDFQDAPVVEILTALAKYAERNIVATNAVSGTMSLHLTNVTVTEALDVVVKLNELDYALIGDRNYIVGTVEEVARFKPTGEGKLPLQVVYKPQATTPERIAHEMQDSIDGTGVTIRIFEDTRSVVFSNVPDQETAERLQQMASELDVPPADTTRWVQLEHLTAEEAAAALEDLVTDVDFRVPGPEAPRVGVIGLYGKTVDVDRAEGLLATIDVERPAIEDLPPSDLVSRTLLVSYVGPKEVAEVITTVYGEQVQAVPVSTEKQLQDAKETDMVGGLVPAGRVLVRGPESLMADVERLVAEVDAPPPQVEITATITDVRVDRDKNVGFQWELPGLIISEESTAGDGYSFGKFIRAPLNATGAGAFASSFDALEKNTDTTILSRTTLIALQGKTANFLVGDIIPYETSVAADGTVTRSVEFEEIGLGLKFAPTVDAQGNINIYISPRVRSFSGFSPAGYPIIATREAQTIMRCRDGDVVAIGGLLRDEEIRSLSGIPFLKDLPLFGELFKKRQTQKRKSEVVVFAEVKLMQPDRQPAGAAVEEMGR
jgi:type II secretory pathway component GspD/PulD (secretin)